LERLGIGVFQYQFGRGELRGFSLADKFAPLIAANQNDLPQVRVFTLGHELAHLALRDSAACIGISATYDASDWSKSEKWCDQVSAALLLPKLEITAFVTQDLDIRAPLSGSDHNHVARTIAREFKVSVVAAAIRLVDLGLAKRRFYRTTISQGEALPDDGGGRTTRINFRTRKYGLLFPRRIIEGSRSEIISEHTTCEFLNISPTELEAISRAVLE
jgi:Zn-dependent peptidase ImmA (M78 family)